MAILAGVSTGTVSRAISNPQMLSPATLERVNAAIRELRLVVNVAARTFKTQKTRTLLLMAADLGHPFMGEVIRGAVGRATELGYSIILDQEDSADAGATIQHYFEARRIDGVAFLWGRTPIDQIYSRLAGLFDCPPIVGVRQGQTKPSYPHVALDNEAAAYRIARYALDLGHCRVGILSSKTITEHSAARVSGFLEALREFGLSTVAGGHLQCDLDPHAAKAIAPDFLALSPRPSLVLTTHDLLAAGLLAGLRDMPAGISLFSVTGFDDLPLVDCLNPALTTVRQPRALIGHTTIDLLVRLIRGDPSVPDTVTLEMPLVVRDSVCACVPEQ